MNFVVAVDGSEPSDRAVQYALDLATAADATLTVVNAVDPAVYDTGGSNPAAGIAEAEERLVAESVEEAEARGERVLAAALDQVPDAAAVAVDTELLYGTPVEAIADYADTEDCDAVVVGHRGLSERQERVLGSVAKGLVERSPVPVTVVR